MMMPRKVASHDQAGRDLAPRGEARDIGALDDVVEIGGEAAAVDRHAHRRDMGEARDEVATAELDRIEPKLAAIANGERNAVRITSHMLTASAPRRMPASIFCRTKVSPKE